MSTSNPKEAYPTNDAAYKEFFSEPRMVVGLLTDLIPNNFSNDLDFSTLEKVPTNYVDEDMHQRFNDVVWKVKWKENNWAYLILMLEFQSQPDWLMALRITQYSCLLYSDLAKADPVKTEKKFPAIFPIVIYNGNQPWNVAQNINDLITHMPDALAEYQLRQKYCLLDMGRLSEDILHNGENLTVQLVRLERSKSVKDVQDAVKNLCNILRTPENLRLRRILALRVRILLKRSGILAENIPELNDLTEVATMLAESCAHWKDEWKEELREELREQWKEQLKEELKKEYTTIGEATGKARGEASGKARGLNFALDSFLKTRFGVVADDIDSQFARISDAETLQDLLNSAYRAASLEDFKKDLHNKLQK